MYELEKEIEVSDELFEANSEGDNNVDILFSMLDQGRKKKDTARRQTRSDSAPVTHKTRRPTPPKKDLDFQAQNAGLYGKTCRSTKRSGRRSHDLIVD